MAPLRGLCISSCLQVPALLDPQPCLLLRMDCYIELGANRKRNPFLPKLHLLMAFIAAVELLRHVVNDAYYLNHYLLLLVPSMNNGVEPFLLSASDFRFTFSVCENLG